MNQFMEKRNDTITITDITHRFGDHTVLDHLSLNVRKGEIFGLLGPSGAGKTTLIKLLTGQLAQTDGQAALFGTDTRKLGQKEHAMIGAMMDNFGLYERLSAWDNLTFYAQIYQIPRHTISAATTDILKRIGLYEARKTAVSGLSKGMKNRLSLARALMNQPRLLFLDEPTSGLDPVTTREIHAILREQKKNGTTIFLTTHNMFEAESLCDHVGLLSNGQLIEYGNPHEICRKYNHLNKIQITLKNGETVSLTNDRTAAVPLAAYLEKEDIAAIHSTEPTLESVFIELTGRGLD